MSLKEVVENHPFIVVVVVVSGFLSLLLNAVAVMRAFAPPHNFLGASEVANEYYVQIESFDSQCSAQEFVDSFMELSTHLGRYSSKHACYTGIEPDQIFIAQSDRNSDEWLVGIDRVSGQGSLVKAQNDIKEIAGSLEQFKNSECHGELPVELKENFNIIEGLYSQDAPKAKYFSISRYSATHSVQLRNVRSNE